MSGTSFSLGKIRSSVNTIVSSGGTTTLLNNSDFYQYVTGTLTQTIQLPDATTMRNGLGFTIANASTGVITIKDNGSNTLCTVPGGFSVKCILANISTSNGTWMLFKGNL